MGNVSDAFEKILVEGLRCRNDRVRIVETQLCTIQSSNRATEPGTVPGEVSWSVTARLKLSAELFCAELSAPYLRSSQVIIVAHVTDAMVPSS